MNKKEVSMFLTAITGRLLCAKWSAFHKWAKERLGINTIVPVFGSGYFIQKEIADTITDAEWREIADLFIEPESKVIDKEALQALCMDYDYCSGEYPESFYEGYSIYTFYLKTKGEEIGLTRKEWMKIVKNNQMAIREAEE